jgi:hypothetical protein
MFRRFAGTSLATLASAQPRWLLQASRRHSAEAFGGRYERGYETPAVWLASGPPVVHGYWGQRRWQPSV